LEGELLRKLRSKLFWWLFDREFNVFTREQVDAMNAAVDRFASGNMTAEKWAAMEARGKVLQLMGRYQQ
jgi:hypothetical protein